MIGGGVDPVDAEADHNGECNNEEEPAAVDGVIGGGVDPVGDEENVEEGA